MVERVERNEGGLVADERRARMVDVGLRSDCVLFYDERFVIACINSGCRDVQRRRG